MEIKNTPAENDRAALLDIGAAVITELYCSDMQKQMQIINEAIEDAKQAGPDAPRTELEKMCFLVYFAFMKGARAALHSEIDDTELITALEDKVSETERELDR